jgi:hypothetical protein
MKNTIYAIIGTLFVIGMLVIIFRSIGLLQIRVSWTIMDTIILAFIGIVGSVVWVLIHRQITK